MTAMPVVERMTAEEFLALPHDERRWAELVDGELVVHEPTASQLICSEIHFELMAGRAPKPIAVSRRSIEVRSASRRLRARPPLVPRRARTQAR